MATKRTSVLAPTAIVTDGTDLDKGIKSFASLYGKAHILGQHLFVSLLAHTVTHGNPDRLNRFYAVLKTNDQVAARNYVRRIAAVVGGWDGVTTVKAEEMEEFKSIGLVMTFKDGAFRVRSNDSAETVAHAKELTLALLPELLIPDGKVWRPFMETNNFAEVAIFGDDEVMKALKAARKKAIGESDSVETKVSAHTIAVLTEAINKLGPATVTVGSA